MDSRTVLTELQRRAMSIVEYVVRSEIGGSFGEALVVLGKELA